MGQIADGFEVVLETVHGGDKRQGNQTRARRDGAVHIFQQDTAIAVGDPGDIAACLGQLQIQRNRAEEMQRICHDPRAGRRKHQGTDDHLLAGRRALHEGDLIGIGIDEAGELFDGGAAAEFILAAGGMMHAVIQIGFQRGTGGTADRVL